MKWIILIRLSSSAHRAGQAQRSVGVTAVQDAMVTGRVTAVKVLGQLPVSGDYQG